MNASFAVILTPRSISCKPPAKVSMLHLISLAFRPTFVLQSTLDVSQGRMHSLSHGGFNSHVEIAPHHLAKRSVIMAQRLSLWHWPPILATLFLLLATQFGTAQSPSLPTPPPGISSKQSEPAPAAKKLSAQEVDGLIEKAFGKDCAELKRPIRIWIPDIGMVIAAEKASVTRDGLSVRFTSFCLGFSFKPIVLRGEEARVVVENPLTKFGPHAVTFAPARLVATIALPQGLAPLAIDCRPSGAKNYLFTLANPLVSPPAN
jgi:hypothetical protein